jgi:hypothetical protein
MLQCAWSVECDADFCDIPPFAALRMRHPEFVALHANQ